MTNLSPMFKEELHDIIVTLVCGEVQGGEELLVLVVQVAALPAQWVFGQLLVNSHKSF